MARTRRLRCERPTTRVSARRSYGDNYIRAFYLPSEQILQWARAHPEYTAEMLKGVLNVSGAALSKRDQQELAARNRAS